MRKIEVKMDNHWTPKDFHTKGGVKVLGSDGAINSSQGGTPLDTRPCEFHDLLSLVGLSLGLLTPTSC